MLYHVLVDGEVFLFVYFLQLIILNTFSCTFKSGKTGMLKMFFLNSQAVDSTTVYVSFVNNLVVLFSEEKKMRRYNYAYF